MTTVLFRSARLANERLCRLAIVAKERLNSMTTINKHIIVFCHNNNRFAPISSQEKHSIEDTGFTNDAIHVSWSVFDDDLNIQIFQDSDICKFLVNYLQEPYCKTRNSSKSIRVDRIPQRWIISRKSNWSSMRKSTWLLHCMSSGLYVRNYLIASLQTPNGKRCKSIQDALVELEMEIVSSYACVIEFVFIKALAEHKHTILHMFALARAKQINQYILTPVCPIAWAQQNSNRLFKRSPLIKEGSDIDSRRISTNYSVSWEGSFPGCIRIGQSLPYLTPI